MSSPTAPPGPGPGPAPPRPRASTLPTARAAAAGPPDPATPPGRPAPGPASPAGVPRLIQEREALRPAQEPSHLGPRRAHQVGHRRRHDRLGPVAVIEPALGREQLQRRAGPAPGRFGRLGPCEGALGGGPQPPQRRPEAAVGLPLAAPLIEPLLRRLGPFQGTARLGPGRS